MKKWKGLLDLNQGMTGSKPVALPLGEAPVIWLEIRDSNPGPTD